MRQCVSAKVLYNNSNLYLRIMMINTFGLCLRGESFLTIEVHYMTLN